MSNFSNELLGKSKPHHIFLLENANGPVGEVLQERLWGVKDVRPASRQGG